MLVYCRHSLPTAGMALFFLPLCLGPIPEYLVDSAQAKG